MTLALFPLVSVLFLPQAAQRAADAALPGALQPLHFLVGSCWAGTFRNGATDTHCFEPVYGHFVRDRHEVTGDKVPYRGETLYWWDSAQRVIRFTYWNSNGGVSEGTARFENGELVFPESHRSPAGQVEEFRSVWRKTADDEYVARTEKRTTAGWGESFRIQFRRVGPATAR